MTFGNGGISPSCDNRLQLKLDYALLAKSPLTNWSQLNLVDQDGNTVEPVNLSGEVITDTNQLQISMTELGNNTYEFTIGNPSANVCLPPQAEGSFDVYATVHQ